MSQPLTAACLENALLANVHFLLCQPVKELHIPQSASAELDIRIQDYCQRRRSASRCPSQLVRAVLAVQHTARQYDTWATKWSSNDVKFFCTRAFSPQVDIDLVVSMIRDGQRLAWLQQSCQNYYVSYAAAYDWDRFQATSDDALLEAARCCARSPRLQGFYRLLTDTWPLSAFSYYKKKVLHFAELPVHQRTNWILSHSQRCWACVLAAELPPRENAACTACELWSYSCKTQISDARATIWAVLKSLENNEDGGVVESRLHTGESDTQCDLNLLELLSKVETAIKGKQKLQDKAAQEESEHVAE